MSRPGSNNAAPPALVERVPKVRLDVLSSRLLHEQDFGDPSTTSSSSSLSSLSSSALLSEENVTAGAADSTKASPPSARTSSPPRISLSALARAETQLHRPVVLSSGGLAVDFSAEDIRHITDKEVLRVLAGEARRNEHSSATSADMEAQMAALQREIDTFITAVDSDGRSYEIRMGASGHRQMRIAENALEEEQSDAEGVEDAGEKDQQLLQPALLDVDESPSLVAAVEKPSSAPSRPTRQTAKKEPKRSLLAAQDEIGSQSHTHQQPQPHRLSVTEKKAAGAASSRLTPSPPPPRSVAARAKAASSTPSVPVRPQAGLTDAEESRVETLLDDTAAATLAATNPFACATATTARLRELEERIEQYVLVRGGQAPHHTLGAPPPTDDNDESPNAETGLTATPAPSAATTAPPHSTAAELGNAYMRRARQTAVFQQRLRSVNERLRALQRRNEEFMALPSADTPADILAMRPSWAQPFSVEALTEAEVQSMLAAARAEDVRARDAGLGGAAPVTADPYAELRSSLGGARDRAMALLATYEASPPALRDTPSPVSSDGEPSSPE